MFFSVVLHGSVAQVATNACLQLHSGLQLTLIAVMGNG
jgi:hypothetical protein